MQTPRGPLVILLSFALSGCAIRKDLETPFAVPDNKSVLHDPRSGNAAGGTKDCLANAQGKFDPTAINMTTGQNADGSAWSEGGGCVARPIREVWAVMNNWQAMKWDAADSSRFTRTLNPTPDFTHLYAVTYDKGTLIGPIEWTIDWYMGLDGGTFLAPERVNIIYGRTSGTSNIPIWSGGVTLTKISDNVTSIEIHNNFKARQSSSDNLNSTQDCLRQIINHARGGSPDWTNLNAGLKPNPSVGDAPPIGDPLAAASICVKDARGNYSSAPTSDSASDQGISTVNVRACLPVSAAALYATIKNPVSVLWKNAENATAMVSTTVANTQIVTYTGTHAFLHGASSWTQDWSFAATAATATTPESYSIRYGMDPATSDYPVWSGEVAIIAVDANTSAVQIQNHLLLDSVSASPAENAMLTQGVIRALTPAASSGR